LDLVSPLPSIFINGKAQSKKIIPVKVDGGDSMVHFGFGISTILSIFFNGQERSFYLRLMVVIQGSTLDLVFPLFLIFINGKAQSKKIIPLKVDGGPLWIWYLHYTFDIY
jgi:hypothetical protein